MLLPASRYAEALELALAETQSLRMGDPLDPQSFLGPMCSAAQRRTVRDYIQVGQQQGRACGVAAKRPTSSSAVFTSSQRCLPTSTIGCVLPRKKSSARCCA